MRRIILALALIGLIGAGLWAQEEPCQDPECWIEYMRQGGAEVRKEAREALIALGPAAVPTLIEATRDESDWIRWEAVNALGSITFQDPESVVQAIPALVERALTDINPHPRWRSLWALATFPDEIVQQQVIPLLRKGLEEEEPRIVWNAAVALAYFGQADVAPLLNRGIQAEDEFQRWEAVYCLGMVHNDESVSLLMAVVSGVDEYPTRLRQEAANTLGKIGDPQAIPALLSALDDPESGVRWRAASALARIGDPTVLPELRAALVREQDPMASEQIQSAIAQLMEKVTDNG